MKGQQLLKCALILAAVIVLGMMVKRYQTKNVILNEEFEQNVQNVTPSNGGNNAGPSPVVEAPSTPPPVQCLPRDRLTAQDLLPQDAANSQFAQVNPSGQGDADSRNHLTAGYTLGVNSIGNSLRNANMQLRSEPPNPQLKVSPWMNTTIGPDLGRRPLE